MYNRDKVRLGTGSGAVKVSITPALKGSTHDLMSGHHCIIQTFIPRTHRIRPSGRHYFIHPNLSDRIGEQLVPISRAVEVLIFSPLARFSESLPDSFQRP